jgi:AmmeMemoRadiSam system protein A
LSAYNKSIAVKRKAGLDTKPIDQNSVVNPPTDAPENRPEPQAAYGDDALRIILDHTAAVVRCAATGDEPPALPPELSEKPCFGLFVTLKRSEHLRGCRGIWGDKQTNSLGKAIRHAAYAAVRDDPRFPSIAKQELNKLSIEVSLLHNFKEVEGAGTARATAVEIGRHGAIIFNPQGRALLLPQVALEQGWNSITFLEKLAAKAGLNLEAWSNEESILMTFEARVLKQEAAEVEWSAEAMKVVGQSLLRMAVLALSGKQARVQAPQILAARTSGPLGLQIKYRNGRTALMVLENTTPLELLDRLLKQQREISAKRNEPFSQIEAMALLAHALPLSPTDHPDRWHALSGYGILASFEERHAFISPGPSGRHRIELALKSLETDMAAWRDGKVSITAFSTLLMRQRR